MNLRKSILTIAALSTAILAYAQPAGGQQPSGGEQASLPKSSETAISSVSDNTQPYTTQKRGTDVPLFCV